MLIKSIPVSLIALLLSACVAPPSREDATAFTLLQEGRVGPQNTQVFAECLLDRFDATNTIWLNVTNRQQRRTGSYRVESLAGGTHLFLSADVFDDGRVALYKSNDPTIGPLTSSKREAFAKCLHQYGVRSHDQSGATKEK